MIPFASLGELLFVGSSSTAAAAANHSGAVLSIEIYDSLVYRIFTIHGQYESFADFGRLTSTLNVLVSMGVSLGIIGCIATPFFFVWLFVNGRLIADDDDDDDDSLREQRVEKTSQYNKGDTTGDNDKENHQL